MSYENYLGAAVWARRREHAPLSERCWLSWVKEEGGELPCAKPERCEGGGVELRVGWMGEGVEFRG